MNTQFFRRSLIRLAAISLVSTSFVQTSNSAVIGSQELIDSEDRSERIARIETILAREGIAEQFTRFGVTPEQAKERIRNMTDEELVHVERSLGAGVVGGDALATIGAVFLVLLILELVGVTDIFKSI